MSDNKPKFSLLGHLKEKQNVESQKPAQTSSAGASGVPRFKPASGVVIPGLNVAPNASQDSTKAVPEKPASGAVVLDGNNAEKPTLPTGNATAVATIPTGGLTHQLEAMKLRAEAGKKALEALYITEHQDFNSLLERLDSMFDDDLGLDDFNVQPARDIVEVIMKQLKEDPNLDGMMIDKDVGNILAFVRKVKGVALDAAVTKKAKAETKAINANKKSIGRFDPSSLDSLDFSTPVSKGPKSIQDMSNIDIDKLKF